jgi:hypothetical protein
MDNLEKFEPPNLSRARIRGQISNKKKQ